jgi:hypothetical protein
MILETSRRSRTFRKDAAMSGALQSAPSAHDMAASSAGAGAHGRGLARAMPHLSRRCSARDKDAGVRVHAVQRPSSPALARNGGLLAVADPSSFGMPDCDDINRLAAPRPPARAFSLPNVTERKLLGLPQCMLCGTAPLP